ncbi:MAG: hypothetical protein AB1650_09790 [Candidatus Omnitrophota bacterium]
MINNIYDKKYLARLFFVISGAIFELRDDKERAMIELFDKIEEIFKARLAGVTALSLMPVKPVQITENDVAVGDNFPHVFMKALR